MAPQSLKDVWEHDGVRCTAVCIAGDWSLKGLYTPESGNTPFGKEVADALFAHGVRGSVYAPTVTDMNARFIDKSELTVRIPLAHGLTLYRNPSQEAKADANDLDPSVGDTGLISGGGCPKIVAIGDGAVIDAHGSRDSLIDRHRIKTEKPSREHESVIHAIAHQFNRWRIPLSRVHMRVYFTVPQALFTHPFSDPVHGEDNRAMHRDIQRRKLGYQVMERGSGALSIPSLCVGLARQVGITEVRKYCPLPQNGRFGHTRHPEEALKNARNLEFVTVESI